MSWRAQARALEVARRAVAALETDVEPSSPVRVAPRPRVVGSAGDRAEPARSEGKPTPPPDEVWGAVIRGQAKTLFAALPPDPDAELHRRVLFFASRPC